MATSQTVLALAALTLTLGGVASRGGAHAADESILRPVAEQTTTRQVLIGTGELAGVVIAADNGHPLAGAAVSLDGQADPAAGLAMPVGGRGVRTIPAGNGTDMRIERFAVTDESGHFAFDRLPPGAFRVTVRLGGFLDTNYGQSKPGRLGAPIPLGPGQHTSISIGLIRGGAISGVVLDENAQPAAGARVQAVPIKIAGSRPEWTQSTEADDRGMYRIGKLQPGDYLVRASPNSPSASDADRAERERAALDAAIHAAGPAVAASPYAVVTVENQNGTSLATVGGDEPPTYWPGTASAGTATTITIGVGEERTGVDVRLLAIHGTDVAGTITNPPSMPLATTIRIRNDIRDPTEEAGASFVQNGRFVLKNLAPGQYTVFAKTMLSDEYRSVDGVMTPTPPPPVIPHLWGRASLVVDGRSSPTVAITLQPGRTISGQVIFQMAAPPDLTRTRITATLGQRSEDWTNIGDGGSSNAKVGPDGRFTFTDVSPGAYAFGIAAGQDFFLESSIAEGVDTLDFPLDFDATKDVSGVVITVSDRPAEVSGTVTDASGKPADETIVIAPADPRFWTTTPMYRRIRTADPDATGHYSFTELPAGEYWIAAASDVNWRDLDPDFLKALAASATAVTLREGSKVQVNLRAAR